MLLTLFRSCLRFLVLGAVLIEQLLQDFLLFHQEKQEKREIFPDFEILTDSKYLERLLDRDQWKRGVVIFPFQTILKKNAEDTVVPPPWGKRGGGK